MPLKSVPELPDEDGPIPQHFTVPEVAKLLKVSETTVYAMVDAGEIEWVDVGRKNVKQIRITAPQLRAYLDPRTVARKVSA
jgi:excisionase family DNA binding protein